MTAETSPPDGASAHSVLARSGCLKGHADAVNVTDGAGAKAHMSALAAAAILARDGIEPVLQFTVRDRNRLALQGDLIGAAALGIHNILCLHGDDPKNGDQPETKAVYDIDSRSLMTTARHLRNEGRLPSGRTIDPPPRLFIGAADSPTIRSLVGCPRGLPPRPMPGPISSRPSIVSTSPYCAATWRGLASMACWSGFRSSSASVRWPRPDQPAG